MDSYRGFEGDAALPAYGEDEPVMERPPEIGVDERRMHVRAYNYWVSLLDGRPFPAIEDLNPNSIEDFGPHSVLLDFTRDAGDPEIAWLGRALRVECSLDAGIRNISQVPKRSLLSRLTDHYMQIIANEAPIGFEAEFTGQRGHPTMYRGILMPLSSTGDQIDFIYGVINWKELADSETATVLTAQVGSAVAEAPAPPPTPVWADGPSAGFEAEAVITAVPTRDEDTLELWPDHHEAGAAMLGDDAGLADRLSLARDSADAARTSDHRSRSALYRALSDAYDFACAADAEPEDYRELLADAGLKAQARAPMTPVVKLVFGADYDKTRLTEYAAALSWAKRHEVASGAFFAQLEAHAGGLKALVAEERKARRPAPKPDRWDAVRAELRARPALGHMVLPLDGGAEDFVLLLARREGGDRVAVLAPIDDAALTERAIRKSAA